MHSALIIILFSSLAIGLVHTLIGPDHYVPLIAIAKARDWSLRKSFWLTLVCGIAHVLSAAILGVIAILLGFGLSKLSFIEAFRGNIAVWILIGFGLVYFLWSVYKIVLNKHHHHHHHFDTKKEITPWVLVLIFVLGPCEPLIPLIMYPAVEGSAINVILVTLVFGLATIVTMISMVMLTIFGTKNIKFNFFHKYGNAMAGAIICCSGVAIKVFGL